ncbi:MAG: hypothetical protein BWK79_04885 [Beggiatoa sp. IS2]|nr:MAG: hypothetical protein BWK79_04885 [Beggiatoa sp. IS2]
MNTKLSDNLANTPLRYTLWWLAMGILLIIVIIIASLMPVPDVVNQLPQNTDKLQHFIAYFILMGWFVQIYHLLSQRVCLAICFILLGLLLEILQGFSGIRHADWTDILANSLGILLAWQVGETRFSNILIYFEKHYLNSDSLDK